MRRFSISLSILLLFLSLSACAGESARQVTLIVDGQTRTLNTEALTVRDLLAEADVALDEDDRVHPSEPTLLRDGTTVRVTRVEFRNETEERDIPFERRVVRDASIAADETRLLEPGIAGVEQLTYRVVMEDGIEVDRLFVKRETLREPRTEVVLIGTRAEQQPVPITGTIAYLADRNAWAIQTMSPNRRRLTYAGDLDGRVFSLSPDGAYLLFTRPPTATADTAPINTLWMIDTATADAEPIQLDAQNVLWADWSPQCEGTPTGSGCRIAYTTGVTATGNPGWKARNDLWLAQPRASDGELVLKRRVVEPSAGGTYGWWGTVYAWSPDGRRLAYARADEVGVTGAFNGQQETLIRFPPYRTYAPWVWTPTISWSAAGDFIVTTLHGPPPTGQAPEDSPVFDVGMLSIDTPLTATLVSEAGMWAAPTFGPAGEHIAFGQARSPYASYTSGYDLYVMDRDGSNRRRLFPPQEEVGLTYPEVAWGPGGDQLSVVYQGNIYLLSPTDGSVNQLTTEGTVTTVRWAWGKAR